MNKIKGKSLDAIYTHQPRLEFLRQVQDNMVPQWRKKYINAMKMDRKLQQIFLQVSTSRAARAGADMLMNVSEEFKNFFLAEIDKADEFFRLSFEILKKQIDELSQIEPSALSKQNKATHEVNLRGVYKNLVFVSNFQMLNCQIVYYFKDCYYNLVKINNHLVIDDISKELLEYLNNKEISDVYEMKMNKQTIIDLLQMMNSKMTIIQVQNQLDEDLSPEHSPKDNMINAFTIGLFLGIGLMLLGCVFSCITWEYNPNSRVVLKVTQFQRLAIRYSLGIAFYQIGAAVMLAFCEQANINWEFLIGLDKNTNKYGARSVGSHAFISWCVASYCCCMSMAKQAYTLDGEPIILQIMFGRVLGQIAQIMPADVWLMMPLVLCICRTIYGIIRQKVFKKPSLDFWIASLVYKLHQPFGHSITFVMSAASVNAVGINTMYVDLADMISLLITKKQMHPIGRQLFLLFPSFVRNWYLIKKYREKYAFNPHGLNFIKYLLIIPFSFQFYKWVQADPKIFYGMVGSRVVELIYNIIWDYVQDFGQFDLYGDGMKKFKDRPEIWLHPILVKRPSNLPVWGHALAVIFDFMFRILWCFRFWTKIEFCQGFMYDTIILFGGLARCALWCLFRFDNQQTTNQGDMLTSLYVPQKIQMSVPTDLNDQLQQELGTNFNEENTQLSRVGSIQDFRASEMTTQDDRVGSRSVVADNKDVSEKKYATNVKEMIQMHYYADEGEVADHDDGEV